MVSFSAYLLFLGGQEHGHEPAFQLGVLFHVGRLRAGFGKVNQQLLAQIGVSHLTATELHADLDTVAVGDELLGSLDLGVEVIGVDAGAHADLFDLHDLLVLLGILFPLLLIVAELGLVHDLANGRGGIGRNFDQIQTLLLCHGVCLCSGNNAQLSAVGADQADLFVADLLIELMF